MRPDPLRVAVVGSTTWSDRDRVVSALDSLLVGPPGMVVMTGMADGADALARQWAADNDHPLLAHPLEHGRYPGPMHRYNEMMMSWCPDLVLAFKENFDANWKSEACVAGTEHFCRLAFDQGVPVLRQVSSGPARGE